MRTIRSPNKPFLLPILISCFSEWALNSEILLKRSQLRKIFKIHQSCRKGSPKKWNIALFQCTSSPLQRISSSFCLASSNSLKIMTVTDLWIIRSNWAQIRLFQTPILPRKITRTPQAQFRFKRWSKPQKVWVLQLIDEKAITIIKMIPIVPILTERTSQMTILLTQMNRPFSWTNWTKWSTPPKKVISCLTKNLRRNCLPRTHKRPLSKPMKVQLVSKLHHLRKIFQ